jgi:hypothetical protein
MIIWKLKLHYVDPKAAVKTEFKFGIDGKWHCQALQSSCGPLADWQLFTFNRNSVSCGHCLNKLKKIKGGHNGT